MSTYKFDVFLSHNSQDKPAVKCLAAKLEDEAKLKVFFDVWNLVPGEPWQEELEKALSLSHTVAVFLGPAGISGWHNEELRTALALRVKDTERRVIPVLLPGTTMPDKDDVPAFLKRLSWVDFRKDLQDEETFRCLVAGICGEAPGRNGDQPVWPPKAVVYQGEGSVPQSQVNTGGGVYIGGSVDTGGGDFVGRDKIVSGGNHSVVNGGNISGSTIVNGNHNVVNSVFNLRQDYIQVVYNAIEKHEAATPEDKEDMQAAVQGIQEEDQKGEQADESFISRRLRNIQRIAPDILQVVLATIANPLAGFGLAAQKVAARMKAAAGG